MFLSEIPELFHAYLIESRFCHQKITLQHGLSVVGGQSFPLAKFTWAPMYNKGRSF